MLPDFPEVKAHAERLFFKAVRQHMVVSEPLLKDIRHGRVHEGGGARLTRSDLSEQSIQFSTASAELKIPREQMRHTTLEQLKEHIVSMAEQFAGEQVRMLLTRVSEASESVGNTVSAKELGAKEAFLEMQRRSRTDFDPETLEPINQIVVLHPSQVENVMRQAAEWDKDPSFVAERAKIRQQKLEEWRAREDSRKLVD